MSDLGSKAALQADIDAKVTSNGNGENTGTRVRAALTNMVDTLSNAGNLSPAPFIYVTAGDDATGIYRYQFMNEGKRCYVLLGATATPENLFKCVVWADPGTGSQWNVTDEIGEILYASASDVATPDLATGWTLDQGTGPLPSIAGYPGPTVQDVLEQIAANVEPSETVLILTQVGTDAPTAIVKRSSSKVGSITLTRVNTGTYRATPAILLDPTTAEVTCGSTAGVLTIAFVDFEDEPGTIYITTKLETAGEFSPQDGALINTTLRIRP